MKCGLALAYHCSSTAENNILKKKTLRAKTYLMMLLFNDLHLTQSMGL